MENKNIKLSFTIPCYNCENSIVKLIDDIIDTISRENEKNKNSVDSDIEKIYYQYEIVCVNDASTDNTLNILINYAKENKNIKVISLLENVGQHIAIIACIRNVSGDIIINLDDDGQTDPKQSFMLINKLLNDYDLVFAKYIIKKESLIRRFGSYINMWIFHILHKTRGFYINSYFACSKKVSKEISEYRAFFEAIGSRKFLKDKKITDVLIKHKEREYGKSSYSLLKLFKLFIGVVLAAFGIKNKNIKQYKIDKIYN